MADAYSFQPFLLRQGSGAGSVDFANDTLKIALIDATHLLDVADDFFDDVAADEVANGNGYTSGGETLANVAAAWVSTRVEIDADDVTWTFTAATTFRYAVIYKSTGVSSTSPLIGAFDFGAGGRTETGSFAIQFDSTGFLHLDAA